MRKIIRRGKTKYPGVRFEDRIRRGKEDTYFSIRYVLRGKVKEEGIGWKSEGFTVKKTAQILANLKQKNLTAGLERSLREWRELDATEHEEERKEAIPLSRIYYNYFYPETMHDKKPSSVRREKGLFHKWIEPFIGHLPLKEISPHRVQQVKSAMQRNGQAPRSVMYALHLIRRIFNWAKGHGLYNGENSPIGKDRCAMPKKFDNQRKRYLTHEEADQLLDGLKKSDSIQAFDLYAMSMLSLECGLRLGEIFKLRWKDIHLSRREISLRDTKSKESFEILMTDRVHKLLKNMYSPKSLSLPENIVFPAPFLKKGEDVERTELPKAFRLTVKELGFNKGINDRLQTVCFHTLRHTFASWHRESGTDLYTLKKLLRVKDFAMVERYSHINDQEMKDALKGFENLQKMKAERKGKVIKFNDKH